MTKLFLDEAEILDLTGKERCNAQERALKFMGIKYKKREDGSLVVLRQTIDMYFKG